MKQSINFHDFCDAFRAMDRNDQFSYEGKQALFEYLEQYEAETGEDMELDVIGLCCEWYESSWEEIAEDYSIDADEDDLEEAVRSYLSDNTIVAGEVVGGCVYLAF